MTYIESQFFRVAPYPLHGDFNGELLVKVHSTHGETNWLTVTPQAMRQIEDIIYAEYMKRYHGGEH